MRAGIVYLIGAGPGDPGLLTLRGLECLRAADSVVFDRLVSRSLLHYAPQAEWIDVGKKPDNHPVPQSEINKILVEKAKAGKTVARLKGGDPFVFGRGGEEALALVEAGLRFEVVPGVTSAVAVPAYAGIPVTQRGMAGSFVVVTGHHSADVPLDYLTPRADTRIYLMGVENLPQIVAGLLKDGLPPDTPAAVITRGTTPQQQVMLGCLADIVQKAAGIEPPAITVVGETTRLHERLAWFERGAQRPLYGLRVLNTRPLETGGLDHLTASLSRLGAEVLELPAFRLVPAADPTGLDASIANLAANVASKSSAYDWIFFTSANAVRFFMERLWMAGCDARILAGARLGVVGNATAQALAGYNLKADAIPEQFTGRELAGALGGSVGGLRVLLPRSAVGLPDLADMLMQQGAVVDAVVSYEPAPVEPDPEALQAILDGKVDIAAFFSPSAVRGLSAMLKQAVGEEKTVKFLAAMPAACVGPTTAAQAEQAGMRVAVVAEQFTLDGLVKGLAAWHSR